MKRRPDPALWMLRAIVALFIVFMLAPILVVVVISFIALGYLGLEPPSGLYTVLARIFAVIYFAYFLGMPFYSREGNTKPVPERVTFNAH